MRGSQQYEGGAPEGEPESIAFEGDIDDRWSYTMIRDWVMFHPDLADSAKLLYFKLRSMIREGGGYGLRRMTVDQVAFLMTNPNAKPVSRSSAKNALRSLRGASLITDSSDAGGSDGARQYVVRNFPPAGWNGIRNAWDRLDSYEKTWRTAPFGEGGQNSDQGAEGVKILTGGVNGLTGGGQNSDQGGQNSVAHKPLTSENAPPEEASPKKPFEEALSPKGAGRAAAPTGAGEREPATPPTSKPGRTLGRAASPWTFSEAIDLSIQEGVQEVGADLEATLRLTDAWDNLFYERFRQWADGRELCQAGREIAKKLSAGYPESHIMNALRKSFASV